VVKIRTEIKVKGAGDGGAYRFCMTAIERSTVAFLEANDGESRVMPVEDSNCYDIELQARDVQLLSVYAVHSHMLAPYPGEITQGEPQLVLLELDAYFSTPYPTAKMTTTVDLYSSAVETWTRHPPSRRKGDTVRYGPYENVPPSPEETPVLVHFQNDAPFATFTHVDKEIEVSHWGNVAIEELIDLKHTGAKLKGGFSRLDYMRGQEDNSFDNLVAVLPFTARDMYYRDVIGNISTSEYKVGQEGIELEIAPRYPMYGGWKTQFYIGYNLPSEDFLTVLPDGRYRLDIELPPAFDAAVVDSLRTKIVLPEGARNVRVRAPYDVVFAGQDASEDAPVGRERRFTFLDSSFGGGRPVVTLEKANVVAEHYQAVQVEYDFDAPMLLHEPMLLVAAWMFVFLAAIVAVRCDLSIVSEREKAEVGDILTAKKER
jgi:oligosaccharyltransferase complex subunit alpha (ribophorin I)